MRFIPGLVATSLALASPSAHADVTADVTRRVDFYKAVHPFMGAVVVAVKHGNYYLWNYGLRNATEPMLVTTPLAVASTTKTFVATSLATLEAEGTLPRETQLHAVIGSLTDKTDPPWAATLAQLVSYDAGLPRELPPSIVGPLTRTQLFDTLSHCNEWGANACYAPGTAPLYSNYGFQILGNVLAKHTASATWGDLNRTQITGPLGMTKTCTRTETCHPSFATSHAHPFSFGGAELPLPAFDDVSAPEGGLWTTGQDMAIWLRYQLGQIAGTTPALAKLDAALPAMRQAIKGNVGFSWKFAQVDMGDGLSHRVRWKGGRYAGFNSYTAISDADDTAVFVFVNRDGAPPPGDPAAYGPDDALRDDLGLPLLQTIVRQP